MRMNPMKNAILAALLTTGVLATGAAPAIAEEVAATPPPAAPDSVSLGDDLYVRAIGDRLWLHVSTRELDGRPAASNGVIVAGEKGVFVIDTPWEDDQTARLLDWIDRAIDKPVLGFVVTHFHDDRMGGIRTVHARGIETWGSSLTAQRARKEGDPPPRHTFKRGVDLSTGTDRIEVFYPGPGHTRDNVAVWLPGRHVLVGGCMVRSSRTRSLGFIEEADLRRWPKSLANVRARCPDPVMVIPGHGPLDDMGAIENTERLLREQAAAR
jgi:glyoxylase-like metal-dependent hydrolase (beta-lactamase superfamily II)